MSLVITIGCPGAGKSYFCDALIHHGVLRLERDRFRDAIFGSRRNYHESAIPHAERSRVITESMLSAMTVWPGNNWAVTDTGLELRAVDPFIALARNFGAKIDLWIFDRPLDVLLERNRTRPEAHRIAEDKLRERFEVFHDSKAWWRTNEWLTARRWIG